MSQEEFEEFVSGNQEQRKKADQFKDDIVCWLEEFPDISASQVYDWL